MASAVRSTTTTVTKSVTSGIGSSKVSTGDRDWSSGLLDCFTDCKSMLFSFCCFPCFMAHQAGRLGEHCCVGCANPIALRTKLRLMLGIKGSICSDCFAFGCCPLCAGCQMSRELDNANF